MKAGIKRPSRLPAPFVIAEAGVNHNGSLDMALRLVDAARKAGADAVKFQSFHAQELTTAQAPKASYQKNSRAAESQRTMLARLELSARDHRTLADHCRVLGIEFMSTPFDPESADLLDSLGMRRFKLPSGEITNFPLLEHVARKKKPVILSTGMSALEEVGAAIALLQDNGAASITLLHCVSAYPAPPRESNLRAMATMARAFGLPVGFSDHTPGFEISIAATALGAVVIEKHFTLGKELPGPDHRMSLDTKELKTFVHAIRNVAAALGDGVKAPRPCEEEIRRVARRSVVLRRALRAGTELRPGVLTCKRPGTGIPPSKLLDLIGKKLRRDAAAQTILCWNMLE